MFRFKTRIAAALLALFALGFVAESMCDAAPQWRQRRWSSRPPIDPSIREAISFRQSRALRASRVNGRGWRR